MEVHVNWSVGFSYISKKNHQKCRRKSKIIPTIDENDKRMRKSPNIVHYEMNAMVRMRFIIYIHAWLEKYQRRKMSAPIDATDFIVATIHERTLPIEMLCISGG